MLFSKNIQSFFRWCDINPGMNLSDENLKIPVKLFLPAGFILMVVVVMTVFIAWSTWQNFDRDRHNAVKWLLREADALIHVMHTDASARIKIGQSFKKTVEQIMVTVGATENIAYLYCMNVRTGEVYLPSGGQSTPFEMMKSHDMVPLQESHIIREIKGSIPILHLIRKFFLSDTSSQWPGETTGLDQSLAAISPGVDGREDLYVVMGLNMDLYQEARQADLHHAGIMIAILLALGAGAVFFVFVIRNYLKDLAHMQHLQRQVQKNEKFAAIGQLSASVAHEIRNPLSSIRGFAQFFVHLFKDHEEHREYAMIMVKELDRINGVITDLITFARPLKLKLKMVLAADLVRHIFRLMEGDASSRGVGIFMAIEESMPPLVVDEDQMKQVLLNLVINALNVLVPGQHITLGGRGRSGDAWGYLWVEDEGPGIAFGDHQQIFNPFFSGGNKGSGLGLAIARKIVENHGGTLAVESPAPGKKKGCRFTITLPMTTQGQER